MTLQEVLLKSGWSQEQIDALDAKAMSGLTNYVSGIEKTAAEKEKAAQEAAAKAEADRKTAEAQAIAAKAAQDAAELQNRSVQEFWTNTYNPGIAAAEAEKTRLAKEAADAKAEAAFYKTQRESYLGTLGIKPEDAPVFTPAAVTPPANTQVTPGTPQFDEKALFNRLDTGIGSIADIQWRYQSLYGKPMPISPSELVKQSEANKYRDPATYANAIFKFAEKEQEQRAAAAKAHDDGIAAAAAQAKEAEWKAKMDAREAEITAERKKIAEGQGSNPDVKLPPGSSKFADVRREVAAGDRKDPLKMTQQERRQTVLNDVHKALEERQAVGV